MSEVEMSCKTCDGKAECAQWLGTHDPQTPAPCVAYSLWFQWIEEPDS